MLALFLVSRLDAGGVTAASRTNLSAPTAVSSVSSSLSPVSSLQGTLHGRKALDSSTAHVEGHVNDSSVNVGREMARDPAINARHRGRVQDVLEHVVGVVRREGNVVLGGRASLARAKTVNHGISVLHTRS